MRESTPPQIDPPRGRHAASRPRGTAPLGRRRWIVAGAVAAACAALLAPPPGSRTATASADAALQNRLSPEQALARLSAGAPSGAITLVSAPVHVPEAQPLAPTVISGLAANGIPNVALNAYRVAAARIDRSMPCGIDWSLLAGIGRVESNHGRFGGATLNSDGTSTPRIIGPALNGSQFAFIRDTDHGFWDGDTVTDRAVGPMQFIPATWRAYQADADGNGVADPFNINDASLAAAHYLCVAGGDLSTDAGQRKAVMAYNHSDAYVNQVLGLAHAYAAGIPVADIALVGNTTSPVPAPSGFYGTTYYDAPASPGPAIGASDNTPATPGSTAGATPAGTQQPGSANGGGSSGGATPANSGGAPSGGSSGSGGGSTVPANTGGSGSGGGAGKAGGSGNGGTAGGAPAPAPVPAPVPAAPTLPGPPPSPPVTPPSITPPVVPPVVPAPPACVPLLPPKPCR